MQKSRKDCVVCAVSVMLLCVSLAGSPSVAGENKPARGREMGRKKIPVPIGVILELDSPLGFMVNNSINLALKHFYSENPNYATRIVLHFTDSLNDVDTAASDLIENKMVHAILGPQSSKEARLVVEHGLKAQVPVIWFPMTGPTLQPPSSPSDPSDQNPNCFQFKAIAAIVAAFGWQSIIPISEDTEYGADLIPCLINVLKEMSIRVPSIHSLGPKSTFDEIYKTVYLLKNTQNRVFLVHMNPDLGSKLIVLAQQAGMMSKGYAWMLTQGLSSLTDPKYLNLTNLKGFMQGALGVKPMDSNKTKQRRNTESAYGVRFTRRTLTLYGWWAYDTVKALAIALESEQVGIVNFPIEKLHNGEDIRGVTGPKLRKAILETYFKGESGDFNLSQGRLEQSVLEVYNVIGIRERPIGYWNREGGLDQNYKHDDEPPSGKYKLKEPMWPGDTMDKPPKLRIGVTRTNFTELVYIEWQARSGRLMTNGFAINVFNKVLDFLPFPLYYEFVAMPNKTGDPQTPYDDLLCQIKNENLDALIGDITIAAYRTNCVDFTLPYLDSSVSMVVGVMHSSTSGWILLEPFHWSLWLILGGVFVGATFIAIMLERNEIEGNKEERSEKGTNEDEEKKKKKERFIRNPFLIYKIDIKEDLMSNASGWMVILTSFLFVIVVQVYTANLTSILTEGKTPKPSLEGVGEIMKKNLSVGYQRDSWVRRLLIEQIGFKESQLRAYGSRDEYNDALSLGTKKGGVDAIFDETPYLMLFLSKYNAYYMMAGPIYKAGGFAFAFPTQSSLVPYFSDAILKVTQDVETFRVLKTKSSLPTTIDELKFEYQNDSETPSLSITDFGGLFPVVLYVLALFFGLSILKSRSVIEWLRTRPKTMIQWLHTRSDTMIQWLRRTLSFKFATA